MGLEPKRACLQERKRFQLVVASRRGNQYKIIRFGGIMRGTNCHHRLDKAFGNFHFTLEATPQTNIKDVHEGL